MRATSVLLAITSTVAAWPAAELSKYGLKAEDLHKRQGNPAPILDPISGILSPLGLGGLTPRSPRSDAHNEAIEQHIRTRLEERDEDVDIDASILTPKAHKKHFEKRGLVGGILAPLTGILGAIDIPTPQESGLKAIPGDVSLTPK